MRAGLAKVTDMSSLMTARVSFVPYLRGWNVERPGALLLL